MSGDRRINPPLAGVLYASITEYVRGTQQNDAAEAYVGCSCFAVHTWSKQTNKRPTSRYFFSKKTKNEKHNDQRKEIGTGTGTYLQPLRSRIRHTSVGVDMREC